jgi:hypothetical protein
MSVIKTSANITQPRLIDKNDDDDDFQARGTLLIKPRAHTMNTSSISSITDRTPSNLLELKRQRLVAAADRKKRLITRIITIVGLLIILLCAAIVTLTLKMAPKIDELVRSKAGVHPSVHLMSRMTTSLMTPIVTSNNFTTNTSRIIIKSTFRLRRRALI